MGTEFSIDECQSLVGKTDLSTKGLHPRHIYCICRTFACTALTEAACCEKATEW